MSKKFSRNRKFDDLDFEDSYTNGYHDELVERRKIKRMKNALKTKNIDDLMNLDDYY